MTKKYKVNFSDKTSTGTSTDIEINTNPCREIFLNTSSATTFSEPGRYRADKVWVGDVPPYSAFPNTVPFPYISIYTTYSEQEKISREIQELLDSHKKKSDDRPPFLIARDENKYEIKIQLVGVDLSQIKVEKHGSKIILFISESVNSDFENIEIEFNNTNIGNYIGQYSWEIPTDIDPLPSSLVLKNGILNMSFLVFSQKEVLEVEGESERDFLSEALNEINS